MSAFVRAAALLAVVVCGVWLPVLWHWQQTHRDVTTGDVVYWLIVLPLLLFAAVQLWRWAWRAVVLPAKAGTNSAVAQPAVALSSAAPMSPSSGPALAWVLGSALNLPAATDPASLDRALRQQTSQPQPDPDLLDFDGLPLHAARLEALSMEALDDDELLHTASERTRRSLAALAPVLQDIAATLIHVPGPTPGAALGTREGEARLRVLLHLPDEVAEPERDVAARWALAQLQAAAPEAASHMELRVLGGHAVSLWQQVEHLLGVLERERRPDLVLLLAAHSELDADLLNAWNEQGLLFHAQRHPRGRMAGEGAAALLLAPPWAAWALPAGSSMRAIGVQRATWAERNTPVDAPGRVNTEALESVMATALSAAQLPTEQLRALCCDVDRHGVRNGELFGAVLARAAHLDALDDVRALSAACGHQGTTALLANLALAAHVASAPPDEGAPAIDHCLVLHLDDPRWRLGLLVAAAPTTPPTP